MERVLNVQAANYMDTLEMRGAARWGCEHLHWCRLLDSLDFTETTHCQNVVSSKQSKQ